MAEEKYARPAPELTAGQRRGKALWRRQQTELGLNEKIRMLLELQRKLHPILQQQRPMRPWERPWEIEA